MAPFHFSQRCGVNARKGNVDASFNVTDACHFEAGWINAIDAAGGEQVTFFDVGAGRYKFQFNLRHAGKRIATGNVSSASAAVEHRDALISVCEQSHFGRQRVNASDLTHHAASIDHWRALCDVFELTFVDDDALVVGVGYIQQNFGSLRRCADRCLEGQQLSQVFVFKLQLFHLL